MKVDLEKPDWQIIRRELYTSTDRLPVFGGWIVRSEQHNDAGEVVLAQTFVADPEHQWEVVPVLVKYCYDCGANYEHSNQHACEQSNWRRQAQQRLIEDDPPF